MPSRSCSRSLGGERRSEQPVLQPVAAPLGKVDFRRRRERLRPWACSGRSRCASAPVNQTTATAASGTLRRRSSLTAAAGARRTVSPTLSSAYPRRRPNGAAVHVVVVGCGRVGSELAGLLEKSGHTVAVVDKRPTAFRRLPTGFGGTTDRRLRLRPRHAARGRHRPRPARSPRSPAATTPTSCRRGSPARPSRSSGSSPASTTPAGRSSTSGSASRRSRPCRGRPTRCMRRLLPDERPADWIDASGQVCLVERDLPAAWAGRQARRARRAGAVQARRRSPGSAQRPCRRPASSSGRRATSCTSSSHVDDLDALRASGSRRGRRGGTTDARRHRGRRQRRSVHRQRAASTTVTRSSCSSRARRRRPSSPHASRASRSASPTPARCRR